MMNTQIGAKKAPAKKHQKTQSAVLRTLVYLSIGLVCGTLVIILGYILIKGVPNLSTDMFALRYNSENASIVPALVNTVTLTALSLLIAVPLGVCSAVYLVEYSRRGNKLVTVIRSATETLSGIPSIVYGLFGYLLFVIYLGWGYSLVAGALTLAVMILPVIMRTTEESLIAVPDTYREGSFGLGAGKLRTVLRLVLPSAMRGILAGVVLSVGRIVGETTALIYTAGSVAQVAGAADSGRTLSIHMYALWNEGLAQEKAYATAVVLLVVVVGLNSLSAFIARRITKGNSNG